MAFIPTICGNKSNITLPTGSCGGITFEGVEDATVNQGEGIDLMDGVTAYDEDGNEIPVTVSPTEIAKCDVGEHTVEYKAIGKGGNLKPYLPCGKGKLTVADCGISVETAERVITITQADPPTISGVETLSISVGTLVNLMDGVSAVDDNGNTVEVEFLGGAVDDVAESDDIATFETDLDVPLKSLKLTLEPKQPCTPWIGTTHDTAPYLHRAMPTQSNDYNREIGSLVGGTVAWNQLVQNGDFADTTGWSNHNITRSISDGIATVTYTGGGTYTGYLRNSCGGVQTVVGHKYLSLFDARLVSGAINTRARVGASDGATVALTSSWQNIASIVNATGVYAEWNVTVVTTSTNNSVFEVKNCICVDLTAEFNPTIADYVYSLEQATAGSGIAWLKSYGFLTEDYIPYSQPTLMSVQATAHKTYDGDGNVIGNYALDSSVTLNGLFQLDNGELKAYGDIYPPDGQIQRLFGKIDLGTLEYRVYTYAQGGTNFFFANLPTAPTGRPQGYDGMCDKYTVWSVIGAGYFYQVMADKQLAYSVSGVSDVPRVWIRDDSFTDPAAFKTAMSGVYLVYELATPTTETATPYTNPQVVDDGGREEYVTSNYVPVGHDSTYSLVCPISGYDEVGANVTGVNVWDEETEIGGLNTSTGAETSSTDRIRGKNYIPCMPNTTYYAKGTYIRVLFYDANKTYLHEYIANNDSFAFTTPSNCHYIRLALANTYGTTYNNDISINYPSTDHDYHAYQGQTYTADLPQTVYGGTVDLVSGALVIDRAMVTLDGSADEGWSVGTNATHYRGYTYALSDIKSHSQNAQPTSAICDKIPTGTWNNAFGGVLAIGQTGKAIGFGLDSLGITNYTDLNEWLSNNPITICYELATPQTIQLTPQEIRTLLGTNNVWSEDATHVMVIFTKSMTEDTQFNVEGLFSVNYRAEDECGNEAIVTRLINVGGVQAEALENENGIALQTEDGEVLIYVAPTEQVNNLVGSAYVGTAEAQ